MSRFLGRAVQTFLGAVLCLGCSSEGVPSFEPIGLLNRTVTTFTRFGEVNVNFGKRTRVDWAALTIITARDKLN